MKIKCDFCDNMIDDTLAICPNCGGPNAHVKRTTNGQPQTIEELKQWYKDRSLPPYETTRFFIGENYQKPRAFGIYKDERTGNFIVYKNKDSGQRAVRYEGTDEAYAVNEIFMRLKQEIIQQKRGNAGASPSSTSYTGSTSGVGDLGKVAAGAIKHIILMCAGLIGLAFTIIIVTGILVTIFDKSPEQGYYSYNNSDYYYFGSNNSWYEYDDYSGWDKMDTTDVPSELLDQDSAKDFFYTPTWDSSTQITDFQDSESYSDYVENHYESNDSWDNSSDDSSYDWDSGDSWDSGGDWDSDW